MESVVDKIIEIDRMADRKISEAKKNSGDIIRQAEEKCHTLKKDISFAADKRIGEVEKINRSDFDGKVAGLEEKYAAEKKDMDSFFETRHNEIEKTIFEEIVGERIESF